MPYFDYPDNIYINPYYLDVTPDIREEMSSRAALYSSKTRSVGIKMYDSVSTKNIEWPYQKVPWAKITTLFKPTPDYKQIELGLAYDKEMSDENGKLILYGEKRNTPAKPLLTGVEISNEGQRGSLLKGKFSFTYFPEILQNGFDLLDLQQSLFTPGRKVHIAFGWSTYASVMRVNKLEFSGVIFGFNWSFNPNMSISAEIQVVSPSSLAIGFSGDQTVNDDSAGTDSVIGKLPDATNLITVIDKDLRGQQEMVELADGSIVGWLPKAQTTTKIFDYVLIKLPITGYSSYLESSAANLQAEEWTSQTPEIIIKGDENIPTGTGIGNDGGPTGDDTNQLAASNVSNWLKSIIDGVEGLIKRNTIQGAWGSKFFEAIATGDIFTQMNTSTNSKIINTGNNLSEFIPADPEIFRPPTVIGIGKGKSEAELGGDGKSPQQFRNSVPYKWNEINLDLNTVKLKQSHSQQLINFKNAFLKKAKAGGLDALLLNDDGLKKELPNEDYRRWTDAKGVNYIGGFMIIALIREIKQIKDKVQSDPLGVIENFFDDLINIKRVEELHYLKQYRIEKRWPRDTSRYTLFNQDGSRNIYPVNWQGAGFDSEGIFPSAKGKEWKGVEIPLQIINELDSQDTSQYNSEQKINGWMNEILKKLGRGDLSSKSDDGSGINETTKNLSDEEYLKKLNQYRNEFVEYQDWIGKNQRTDRGQSAHLRYGTGYSDDNTWKQDNTKTVGGIDIASIEPNMYKFGTEDGSKTIRPKQVKFLQQIIDRIDEIKNSTSQYYLKPYEEAVINEFISVKSEALQKKLNEAPKTDGGGGTTPDIIIPPQKEIENRTYWYIKLGDLVNFANNLIEQYANKSNGDKYTFPLFKMIAHGNETDYNKQVKSAYPVDVYFPDEVMGTYHSFTPFNTEPMKDMLRTFYISEAVGVETKPDEKKARISSDVINIGEILIGLDYIRKTYRSFLYENSTNVAYKNITNFFENIIRQINVATGDIYQLSVMLFEEPERLTSGLSSAKEPAAPAKDGGTNRRALLSVEDSNLSRRHTVTSDEGDVVDENETGKYYRVRPYKFEANIMKPLIKNVNVISRPSKEATFAAYIAARGEEVSITNPEVDVKKAPPVSVDIDLSFGEYKNKKEYDDQYKKNIEEKKKAEESAVDNGFNERWSDTYRGILTKLKRLKYKPDDDGTGAHWLNMAIYPIELTITIDGINGFKFGDVIKTNLIPSHYNTRWNVVFTITKIIHKVTPSTWETTLHTAARLPLDGNPNEGISELGPTRPAAANPNVVVKEQVK